MIPKQLILTGLITLLAACQVAEQSASPPQAQPKPATPTTVVILPPTDPIPDLTETAIPSWTAENASEPTLRISPLDGMPLIYVPAGTVRMGGLDIHADDRDELPAHSVSVDAFWIDQLEVTNAMYMLCVQAQGCTPPLDWASDRRPTYFNDEDYKDYPVVHVTWEQAQDYCIWADRRLPTEAEWERAARGDDFRTYPWGDEPPSVQYAHFSQPYGDTSRVGSYAVGASPFGALDMAGNVWEWVADFYSPQYYNDSPGNNPRGPQTSTTYLRVIRGGSFQDESFNIRVSKRGSELGTNPSAPFDAPDRDGRHSSKIGFRCVSSE